MTCPWCGYPRCSGATPAEPHHSLCCLDRAPAECWRKPTPDEAAAIRNAAREARDTEPGVLIGGEWVDDVPSAWEVAE